MFVCAGRRERHSNTLVVAYANNEISGRYTQHVRNHGGMEKQHVLYESMSHEWNGFWFWSKNKNENLLCFMIKIQVIPHNIKHPKLSHPLGPLTSPLLLCSFILYTRAL